MRRPSSRKRQPASWLMFSWANPENEAIMHNAPLVRSNIALSVGGSIATLINSDRSVSAHQASGEKRSRIAEAADCAAPTDREARRQARDLAMRQKRREPA